MSGHRSNRGFEGSHRRDGGKPSHRDRDRDRGPVPSGQDADHGSPREDNGKSKQDGDSKKKWVTKFTSKLIITQFWTVLA
jgi:hypothetical protein